VGGLVRQVELVGDCEEVGLVRVGRQVGQGRHCGQGGLVSTKYCLALPTKD